MILILGSCDKTNFCQLNKKNHDKEKRTQYSQIEQTTTKKNNVTHLYCVSKTKIEKQKCVKILYKVQPRFAVLILIFSVYK